MRLFARVRQLARSLSPIALDTLLAIVLAVPLLVDLARQEVPSNGPFRDADPIGYVLVAMLVAPLALRRRFPTAVFAVILANALVVAALLYAPSTYGFGLIVATYTVAAHTRRPGSWVALWLAQGFVVVIKIRAMAAGIDVGWFSWPLDAIYVGGGWYLGDAIQTNRLYAEQLERNREELARHAVIEERASIARELHDAVGHAMSVIVIHAGAGRRHLATNPARVDSALEAIGQVGTEALEEMDRLLGVLRSDGAEDNQLIRPSLSNLSHLIDEFRALGLEISLTGDGPITSLSPAVDQTAFRIIQEALTNTLKHAGSTTVEIVTRCDPDRLRVEVRDHGRGPAVRSRRSEAHHGRGLVGMRERVEIHGGRLEVGACPDGGFLIVAELPTTPVPTAPSTTVRHGAPS